MNIFDILFFFSIVFLGGLSAKIVGFYWEGIGGIFCGFIAGCLGALLVWWFIKKMNDKWLKFRPLRPPCINNRCCADDYELLECNSHGELVYRCKCGGKYFKTDIYFMEFLADGTKRPYMERKGFWGRWQKAEKMAVYE
jgi:hypothetical protein